MKKIFILFKEKNYYLFLICLFSMGVSAQEITHKQSNDFWNHVQFGGGIGLSFGSNYFSGTLAPSAIYRFNSQFGLGVGLSGTYNSQKHYYKSSIIGGSLIGLYNPIRELQISAEFEENNVNVDWDSRTGYADDNYWYPSLFLGAGYSTRNVTIGIRFDVLYNSSKSTYLDPWMPFIRIYF
ncbi:alpha-ketoglutarate decarboxylase [Xanthomarina sp. GH4-25]|uniref:alpha-ketoglutarate decarboxylase n=1 Tax=Xanthomarina sp. GH4-25 TaxID=3349335 RepID=UPI000D67BB13|nr:alpha-ketoglutarate decarboxylase [Flavobacteriaceae bacterium LYZ1037]